MVCLFAHGPFQQRAHAQLLADGLAFLILILETERRAAADYLQFADLGEGSDQFLRQSIREILVARITAFVQKREHRDRFFKGRRNSQSRRDHRLAPKHLVKEEAGGEQGNGHNEGGELPGTPLRNMLVRRNILGPFHSGWRHLEGPRDDQCDREAEQGQHNYGSRDAVGEMKRGHHGRRDLHDQPTDDEIRNRDLVNISSLQFGEEFSRIHGDAGFFGASEATIFSKRGSSRSESHSGPRRS